MSLSWLLIALGLAVVGRPAAPRVAVRRRETYSARSLQWLAAVAVGAGCVGLLGLSRGLLAGLIAVPVTVVAIGRLHARPARTRPSASLALCLDLVCAALRSGQPLDAALLLAAPAAGTATSGLQQVAGLLRLGADPRAAWRLVADDPVLAPIGVAAGRSASSGVRLASTFERLAVDMRAQLHAGAQARGHRVEVLAAMPLGLCFLPSFVCLGIVPIVIGVAAGVLGG